MIKKRPMSADGTSAERRKSRRYPVVVPIEVSWRSKDGVAHKEDASARQVNGNGGFVKMENYPVSGSRVTLVNFLSAQTAEARVLAAPDSRQGVANGIVVELIVPNESFWGVDLQVNKTALELENLETALRCEDIDLPLMKEYRNAVEYVRKLTDTLQELRRCQTHGADHGELFTVLAKDRVRRASDLCAELIADIDHGHVKPDAKIVEDLKGAMQQLQQRLRQGAKAETQTRQNGSSKE